MRETIETAPKDGTRVRLFHERDLNAGDDASPTTGAFVGGRWVANQVFLVRGRDGLTRLTDEPTHWQAMEAA